jgi:hypothetical protein
MKTTAARPIEDCLLDLFRHLGVEQAHIAAGGPPPLKDWHSLATLYPERVASLTVISPPVVNPAAIAGLALADAGRRGRPRPACARGGRADGRSLKRLGSHFARLRMATLVGRHRRSGRGDRCRNARLSRSPFAPSGQIV